MKIFGFRRTTKMLGIAKQNESLIGFGVSERDIHPKKKFENWLKDREWMITQLARPEDGDRIAVARLFVLADTRKELRKVVTQAHARGIYFIETDTKGTTDDLENLLEMFEVAADAYGGRWLSPERAAELGALGAKESPVTKRRKGLMPYGQVQRILNDHKTYPTLAIALDVINADKTYKTKWSRERVYREAEDGKLDLIPRVKGRAAKK